ncbi:MAG TPA: helix-turn-helix transcriptional regulator [Iamia sp.]|nr:helix-turn-helix transcriptional regulator [Iamia sp.]
MTVSVQWSPDEEGLIQAVAESWGQSVRRTREKLGLSQRDLAQRAGTTQQSLSKLENGSFLPSDLYKVRLAHALGKDVSRLFAWPEAARHHTRRTTDQAHKRSATSTP